MLTQLGKDEYNAVRGVGRLNEFPIIASVVEDVQDGAVFVDDKTDPRALLVTHKVGFAYLYISRTGIDYQQILDFLIKDCGLPQYFHLYDAPPDFITVAEKRVDIGVKVRDRMRWRAPKPALQIEPMDVGPFRLRHISDLSRDEIDGFELGILDKYWRSEEQFKQLAFGFALYDQEKPMALYYTPAVANRYAESDSFTYPEYRGRGLSNVLCTHVMNEFRARDAEMGADFWLDNWGSIKPVEKFGYRLSFYYKFLSVFVK
jgi:GNAT superfamily N-acetyltransferase